jgi:transcriptional regulator with XRE-family HTH domain
MSLFESHSFFEVEFFSHNYLYASRPTCSRIESGEANPRLSTLLKLADVLGVFVGQLFEKPSKRKGG